MQTETFPLDITDASANAVRLSTTSAWGGGQGRLWPIHTTARELQTCTFEGPGASNTTREKNEKLWRPPPFGAPPFGAPP